MNVTLPPELEELVNKKVSSGEFESAEAFLTHIVSEALHKNGPPEGNTEAPEDLWDAFSRILGDVPEEELRTLPDDFAAEHDHYIYGTPKRAE